MLFFGYLFATGKPIHEYAGFDRTIMLFLLFCHSIYFYFFSFYFIIFTLGDVMCVEASGDICKVEGNCNISYTFLS